MTVNVLGLWALRGAVTAILIWVVVVAAVYAAQRRLLYFPVKDRVSPAAQGLSGVAEVVIATPDGTRLIAWWRPPQPGKAVVLYFHGNGGSIAGRAGRVRLLEEAGVGSLLLSYRGYGGSTGSPSETALVADGILVRDWLEREKGIAPAQIVVTGESLGTGVAVQVAAARRSGGVLLESPYTSLTEVAAGRYWWVPVHTLMSDRFASIEHIRRIQAPLLIVHGTLDAVVPFAMGERLLAAAAEPKRLLRLEGAGHIAPWRDAAWPDIRAFLESVSARP
jgi:uncharacterized protein